MLRRLVGHKEAALALLIAFGWLGWPQDLDVAKVAFAALAALYIFAGTRDLD